MAAGKKQKVIRRKSRRFDKKEPSKIHQNLDLRDVYVRQCKALHVKPNTKLLNQLPAGKHSFTQLTELDVAENYLGDKGCKALIEVVRSCENLEGLNLASNGLTDATIELFLPVLHDHRALTRVNFSYNSVTQEVVPAVKTFLKDKQQIVAFDLTGNRNVYSASLNEVEALLKERVVSCSAIMAQHSSMMMQILTRLNTPPPNGLHRKLALAAWVKSKGLDTIKVPARNMDGWAIVSVFVSATFTDFHTELHVINNRIVPEINARLRRCKVFVSPIDLHQSRQYNCDSIENIQNVKYSIGTLRRAADIFVGLYGEVLGWVPAVDEIPAYELYSNLRSVASAEPTSITYLQYLEANAPHYPDGNHTPLGFYYFRHPNVLHSLPAALKAQYSDLSQRRSVCFSEKKRILQNTPPFLVYDGYTSHFKSVDEHGQVQLCQFQDFEETAQLDIFNAIEIMYSVHTACPAGNPAEEARERLVSLGAEYRAKVQRHFQFSSSTWVGRDGLLGDLKQAVSGGSRDMHDCRYVAVAGPRGSGKSALLAQLANSLAGDDYLCVPYFASLRSCAPDSSDVASLLVALYTQTLCIAGVAPSSAEAEIFAKVKVSAVAAFVWAHLASVASAVNKRVVVLLDDAEMVSGCGLDWLGTRSAIASKVRVVLAVSEDREDLLQHVRHVDPQAKFLCLPPLAPSERKTLLSSMLGPFAQPLDAAQLAAVAKKDASTLPLYCRLLSNEILHRSLHRGVENIIAQAPGDLKGLVGFMLRNREMKEKVAGGLLYFVRFCGVLVVSRAGLLDHEAREVLMKTFAALDPRRKQSEDYVRDRADAGGGGYRSDGAESERHEAAVRSARRRLWGRWPNAPRLLPGGIWSRLVFEMRPFLQRRADRAPAAPAASEAAIGCRKNNGDNRRKNDRSCRTEANAPPAAGRAAGGSTDPGDGAEAARPAAASEPDAGQVGPGQEGGRPHRGGISGGGALETHVLAFTGEAVREAVADLYLNSRQRRARFHAQLGTYYQGKLYIPGTLLWRKALRETVYHLAKAWLWDTLLCVLRPSVLFHSLAQNFRYELLRDLATAEEEVDACMRRHKADVGLQRSLRAHLSAIGEYKAFARVFGLFPAALLHSATLTAPPGWRLFQQAKALFAREQISHMTPRGTPFETHRSKSPPVPAAAKRAGRAGGAAERVFSSGRALESAAPISDVGALVSSVVFTWVKATLGSAQAGSFNQLGVVYLWDLEGTPCGRLTSDCALVKECCITTVAVSRDDRQVLVGSDAWRVLVFDLPSRSLLHTIEPPARAGAEMQSLVFYKEPPTRPDAVACAPKSFALSDTGGRLAVWESADSPAAVVITSSTDRIVDLEFSQGGTMLVVAYTNCSCILHSMATGAISEVASIETPELPVLTRFVRGSTSHIVTCTHQRCLIWLASSGNLLIQIQFRQPTIEHVAYYPHDDLLLVIDSTHSIAHWRVLNDSGSVFVQELGNMSMQPAFSEKAVWCYNKQVVIGAFPSGVIHMGVLGAEAMSTATCFAPYKPLTAATGFGESTKLLPFSAAVACSEGFALTDATSGVPLLIDMHLFKHHCNKLPASHTLD